MKKKVPGSIIVLILLFTMVQCAKKGMPEGGPIDEEPPKFIRANPENYTTQFDKDEIRIYFDEYIKLDKPQQQIIVSPPMDPKPNIMPLGTARKDIKIEIFDTLAENTTYAINFGKSIVDNNESNPYNYFKYVFSTGDYIDSLMVGGKVKDAKLKAPSQPVSVMLYEIDSTYSDSIVYKQTPRYVTYSQDSTFTFSLENLKAGTYKMVGIMDKNDNYLYNPKTEKIGFVAENVTIPTDSTYNITVFKVELEFNPKRPSLLKGNKILFGYEGTVDLDSFSIDLLSNKPLDYDYRIIKDPVKDSLYYWYNTKPEMDSLVFEVKTAKTRDTLVLPRLGTMDRDSLVVNAESGGINKEFKFTANTPIIEHKDDFIRIIDKDSAEVPFTTEFLPMKNEILLKFNKLPENNYQVSAFPGAITDLFQDTNDTIVKSVQTKALSDYGKIILNIQNIRSFPIIVQLTNTKGEVMAEQYSENSGNFTFEFLNPGDFLIRVIYDANSNMKWDTGSYLKKRQPERILYYQDTINVRSNWDQVETFSLE
ncbi:Ig-like domain-containing protein [Christiangramia sp. SM2212]|uniref:Ig-like domain-containing protein n=1 Tax=Christiangramia sediminicola TaxID=3073267 RepID=A0ABU1EL71_9FLAO|nr:Ig-like domain-containing protein [Christiangramia sp. SM2212]MDR5589128.1 Ig-like domain-containing protein [Christiangramia sp. SM2212]